MTGPRLYTFMTFAFATRVSLCAFVATLAACGSNAPPLRARAPEIRVVRDTPAILRATIGAQASVRGLDPTLVSGYGLVVGLQGKGSGDVPGPVRAVMERDMTRLGVGKEIGPFRGMTPAELLNSPDTAVVIVSAVIPPGAPEGTRFDVQVETLPGSATSSLEGGRLYTTDLYQGLIRPAAPSTVSIAKSSGEIFINPFSDPAKAGRDSVRRTVGRILNGGVVSQPRSITLVLDASSHSRARAMAEAINSRFPRSRGEPPTAKGINEEVIEINIPPDDRADPNAFIDLLRHTRVDQAFADEAALSYVRGLKEFPELSEALSLCLVAVGPVAIPHLRPMYEYPEVRPRMAAIVAGAKLGDMMVRPSLEILALTGPPGMRPTSIKYLGRLGQDPKINLFLRDLLSDVSFDVRIAAYEALEWRKDPWVERRRFGDKFIVDSVPSAEPMVYATLQKTPKIVLFGAGMEVRRPVFASAWDGRLMLSNEAESTNIRVYFKDAFAEVSVTGETPPAVVDLIQYLSHRTTPEEPAPGLNFSYSEVVGALEQFTRAGAVAAAFVPESDKLALELIRTRQMDLGEERPELASDSDELDSELSGADSDPLAVQPIVESEPANKQPTRTKKTYVVPTGAPSAVPGQPAGQPPTPRKDRDDR